MIGIKETKRACNRLLADTFPGVPVYGNDTFDGYARPSFFTEIRQRAYRSGNQNSVTKGYSFIATLFERSHDEAYCLDVVDKVQQAFGLAIRTEGGLAVVEEIDYEWIGQGADQLQITVDFINRTEIREKQDPEETMKTLDLDVKERSAK